MPENLQDLIERLLNAISGLGIFLPIGIFVIAQLFSGKDKEKKKPAAETSSRTTPPKPAPAATTATPPSTSPGPVVAFPFGPPAWMDMTNTDPAQKQTSRATSATSQWGHTFDKQDDEKEGLHWGSVFEDSGGEPLRWESAFESDKAQNTYGFDRAVYGSTFPKKSSEPVIHHG